MCWSIGVDVPSQEVVEEWVDEEGPEVFDDEDSPPRDLQAQVFDEDCAAIVQSERGHRVLLVGGDEVSVVGVGDAEAVDVDFGFGGQPVVEVGCAALDVDGRRGGQRGDGFACDEAGELNSSIPLSISLDMLYLEL